LHAVTNPKPNCPNPNLNSNADPYPNLTLHVQFGSQDTLDPGHRKT